MIPLKRIIKTLLEEINRRKRGPRRIKDRTSRTYQKSIGDTLERQFNRVSPTGNRRTGKDRREPK